MTSRSWFRSSLALGALLLLAAPAAMAQGVEAPRVPLRTALDEIATVRTEYAEAYNRKDAAALMSVYADDAIALMSDGTMLTGKAAIGKSLNDGSKDFPHMVLSSDTVRVFGNTAYDIGTVRLHVEGQPEQVSKYLVVLRRGMQGWKLSGLATVPVTSK